jgi:protein-S-isoprenylcysteine O-methyltransferase Ste14
VFTVAMPGLMAGVVPFLITGGWKGSGAPVAPQILGIALIVAGLAVLAHTIGRFVVEGRGTPFPGAPTTNLVVGGLYRYVRNPMYLAVAATIVGQALLLGRPLLLAYAAFFLAVVYTFVRLYEEPVLTHRFGERYERYRRSVPGWIPRRPPLDGRDASG